MSRRAIDTGFSHGFLGRLNYPVRVFKPLLIATLFLALSLPAAECKYRGVWFWQDAGNPYGAANIVGNAVTGQLKTSQSGSNQNRPL